MRLKRAFTGLSVAILAALSIGGWYIFVAGAPQLDAPIAESNTGLRFQVDSLDSTVMGDTRRYGVVLPPGYYQHLNTRYPVIILLHGGHGTERDYEDKARLTSVLHDLYTAQKLPPSIVITPDGNDKRGSSPFWDPNYFDGKNGLVSTFIAQELVKTIQSRYRTLSGPQFWALGGLSSGGWGALNIGLRHLDRFRVFFSHTGYFTDPSGSANSPQQFIQDIPASDLAQVKVYLDAGEADHKYLVSTRNFHELLDRLKVTNEFHVFPGGHGIVGPDVGWNYWHQHLHDSLAFVGTQFQQALTAKEPHAEPPSSHP